MIDRDFEAAMQENLEGISFLSTPQFEPAFDAVMSDFVVTQAEKRGFSREMAEGILERRRNAEWKPYRRPEWLDEDLEPVFDVEKFAKGTMHQ